MGVFCLQYDIRDKDKPHFFSTEDHHKGCTRRFTPNATHWGDDEWKMLHEEGIVDYLFVNPNEERTGGTFEWVDDLKAAKNNARSFYPQSEGIDIQDGKMYVVCKKIQQLFVFDLDRMTFNNVSTVSGLFDGDPDQMQRIIGDEGGLLYFTEEGGVDALPPRAPNLFDCCAYNLYNPESVRLLCNTARNY